MAGDGAPWDDGDDDEDCDDDGDDEDCDDDEVGPAGPWAEAEEFMPT